MVEFIAQVFGDDGADEEKGGGHAGSLMVGLINKNMVSLFNIQTIPTRNMANALGGIHALIETRGYREITLDFSKCTFTHAPPMLAVATATEFYQTRGITFELVLPQDEKVERLFLNSNWAHIIAPADFPLSEYKSLIHMPALRYKTSDEQHHLVDGLLNRILSSITDFERSHFKAIEWSINEITDNVLVHSESPRGGLVQLLR